MDERISLLGLVMGKSYKIHIHLTTKHPFLLGVYGSSPSPRTSPLVLPAWGRVLVIQVLKDISARKNMAAFSGHPRDAETRRQVSGRERPRMAEQPAGEARPCHLLSRLR